MNTASTSNSAAYAANLDEQRWQAVLRRDPAADGRFIYGVLTTGVYCRPSCPSRQARRDNMRFFSDAQQAAQAGFRPCKRCRPQDASSAERQQRLIASLCQKIEQAEQFPTLQQLAEFAQLSPYHLHRVFKQTLGITPKAYANAVRQRRLQHQLATANSVTEACYAAGFDSSSGLYSHAPALLGMAPGTYRAGGASLRINYATAPCSLGVVLVALSSKGVCAILLGNDAKQLATDLRQRFPAAECIAQNTALSVSLSAVIQLVERPELTFTLPLDIGGTAFQQRVWQALQRIPPGQTRSYSEIAAEIGSPRAVRAVASACAANPLALAIPCHRVVRRDGSLSGYRWGLMRKQALLDREAGHTGKL